MRRRQAPCAAALAALAVVVVCLPHAARAAPWRLFAASPQTLWTGDGGAWTAHAGGTDGWEFWSAVAASENGGRLVATTRQGAVFTSTNRGKTWTQRRAGLPEDGRWIAAASSASGRSLAIASLATSNPNNGAIYHSDDAGASWKRVFGGDERAANFRALAAAAKGGAMAAASRGRAFYSRDGKAWLDVTAGLPGVSVNGSWKGVAVYDDGAKLALAGTNGLYFGDVNQTGGVTWASAAGDNGLRRNSSWASIAASADGAVLAVASENGTVYVSRQDGPRAARRWRNYTVPHVCNPAAALGNGFTRVSLAVDGTRLAALIGQGFVAWLDFGKGWSCPHESELQAITTSSGEQAMEGGFALAGDGDTVAIANHFGSLFVGIFELDHPANKNNNDSKQSRRPNGDFRWTQWGGSGRSATGFARLVATMDGFLLGAPLEPGPLLTSMDGGATWVPRAAGTDRWVAFTDIATSKIGWGWATSEGLVAASQTELYVSIDEGVTWFIRGDIPSAVAAAPWSAIAMGGNGLRIVAAANGGGMIVSNNVGRNYTNVTAGVPAVANWSSVAIARDAPDVVLATAAGRAAAGGGAYISRDGAASFRRAAGLPDTGFTAGALSSDGATMVVTDAASVGESEDAGGAVYVSRSYGASWTKSAGLPAGAKPFGRPSVSTDGKRMALIAAVADEKALYLSKSAGTTFARVAAPLGAANLSAVALAADKVVFVAVADNDVVYRSTDFGASFSARGGGLPLRPVWRAIASDASGRKLAAVDGARLFTSDGGGSWRARNTSAAAWTGVCMSANGSVIALASSNEYWRPEVLLSFDGGATFRPSIEMPPQPTKSSVKYDPRARAAITCSADGLRVVVAIHGVGVFATQDARTGKFAFQNGAVPPYPRLVSIASSARGDRVITATSPRDGGYVYISDTNGARFTRISPGLPRANWTAVASSASGLQLLAVSTDKGIHTSVNGGVDWKEVSGGGLPAGAAWSAAAVSPGGNRLAVAARWNGIYVSSDSGKSWARQQAGGMAEAAWWVALAGGGE